MREVTSAILDDGYRPFCVLFRHGPHREAISPRDVVQRTHEALAKAQAADEAHAGRDVQPIATDALYGAERTIDIEAYARSGEIDCRGVAIVGEEVPTKVSTEVIPIFGTLYIKFGRIGSVLSRGSKPRKSIAGRQVEADRAGIVNRFYNEIVVTGVVSLRSGIVGRP